MYCLRYTEHRENCRRIVLAMRSGSSTGYGAVKMLASVGDIRAFHLQFNKTLELSCRTPYNPTVAEPENWREHSASVPVLPRDDRLLAGVVLAGVTAEIGVERNYLMKTVNLVPPLLF